MTPLGWYMTCVFNGERTFLSPVLRPVEAGLYWIGGVDERREQHWTTYTVSMLFFHVGGFLILYALMRLQAGLPFNPAEQSAVAEGRSATPSPAIGSEEAAMVFDYSLAGLVTAGLMIYLVYALLKPERLL